MKTNKIFLLLTMFIISFSISACGISPKEQARLEEYASRAESYYEKKYNTDIEIVDSTYNYYVSTFREYLTSEMVFTTSDNNVIFYKSYENSFSDTRQTKEIYHKISDSLLPELTEYIKNPFYWDYDTESFMCNTELIADEYDKSVFHTYYDEDNWVAFFAKEKPTIYFENRLFIISGETTKYEEITEYITALFSQYMDISRLEIVFLSEELYQQEKIYEIEGEEGFYESRTILGHTSYSVSQNYVQLTDGIYITSLETDCEYCEDDFVISEEMPLKDIASVYGDALEASNDSLFNDDDYTSQANTLFAENGYGYQIDFSDSYKSRTAFRGECWPVFCIKIVSSEISDNLNSFYFLSTCEDENPYFIPRPLEGETTTCYMYLTYTDNTDIYIGLGEEPSLNTSDEFN